MIDLKISEDTPTPIGEVYDGKLVVRVHLLSCPPGTILSSVSHQCECRDFLKKFDIQCDNKRGKVHVKNNQWIGYFNNSRLAVSNNYVLDYLYSIDEFFSLSTPDQMYSVTSIEQEICVECVRRISVWCRELRTARNAQMFTFF